MTTQQLPTTQTTKEMITLASIAYVPASQIGIYLKNPTFSTQGDWDLVWGPCSYFDNLLYTDNLLYVAQNPTTNEYAVVIRGTDLIFSGSVFVDLFEDLQIDITVAPSFSGPPDTAWIAQGTYLGLDILTSFTDPTTGLTVAQYLGTQSPSTLYVTGHSLGGCLTTVLAPYLLSSLAPTYPIVPYTFAAPTAGNSAYATWYDSAFPESYRFYNTVDAIPMAWNNLTGIGELFPQPPPSNPPATAPTCPWLLQDFLQAEADFLSYWGYDYTHTNGAGTPFTATVNTQVDWYQEVTLQHSHVTYLANLGAQPVPLPTVFQTKPKPGNLLAKLAVQPTVRLHADQTSPRQQPGR